jgi:Polyketide cyclase / dehydrase and lipid transport
MPILWPDRYAPDRVAARVSNDIAIAAPSSAVWAWLIRAVAWPDWYPNSSAVRIESGRPTLSLGERFTWRTFGVSVRSTVREFIPGERIAWDGTGFFLDVYHAWLIEGRPDGCWVLTEENQNGLAASVQAFLMSQRMHRGHELWLTRLKAQAEGKPPPPPLTPCSGA